MHLLLHPEMTSLGLLNWKPEAAMSFLGLNERRVKAALDEGVELGFWKHDDAGLIWLRNFLKHNTPRSPNAVKAWANVLCSLEECSLLNEACRYLAAFSDGLPDSLREASQSIPQLARSRSEANPEPMRNESPLDAEVKLTQRTKNKEHEHNQEKKVCSSDDERLRALIDRWNEFAKEKSLASVRSDSLADSIAKGWARVQKSPEARSCFEDLDKLFDKIRASPFLWSGQFPGFGLRWLFQEKNYTWNACKVNGGEYEDRETKKHGKGPALGPGQIHQPGRNVQPL